MEDLASYKSTALVVSGGFPYSPQTGLYQETRLRKQQEGSYLQLGLLF